MRTAVTLLTLEVTVLEVVALVFWEHVRHTYLRSVATPRKAER
jgi:hypothetical protein